MMLAAVSSQLIALCIAALVNVLLGLYNNIGVERYKFDIRKLINGLIKAVIIIVAFIGIAYCFDVTDLNSLGLTPDMIVNTAIILYISKSLQNLTKILGIETSLKKTNTTTITESTSDNSDMGSVG